jgi:hypothetical protein
MSQYKYNPPAEDSSIVPFGKYRGQSVDALLADQNYLDWMLAQPDLVAKIQSKYPALFNIIMVGSPTNDDTPEHNKMQAMLLKPEFQLAFLEACLKQSVYAIGVELTKKVATEANEKLGKALLIAQQDSIRSDKELQEIQKEDAEFKNADWQKHYDNEREEYERKRLEREKEPQPIWSRYLKPFPTYEQWLDTEDYSSWPQEVRRHNERMERVRTRAIKDHEIYQTLATTQIKSPEPSRPEVTRGFECGFDVHICFKWCSSIDDLSTEEIHHHADTGRYFYDRCTPRNWVKTSSCVSRIDEFKIEIKPMMGDDFPAVLRQMKRNCADTLLVGTFNSSVCSLDEVQQMFAPKVIVTLAEVKAIQANPIWPQ